VTICGIWWLWNRTNFWKQTITTNPKTFRWKIHEISGIFKYYFKALKKFWVQNESGPAKAWRGENKSSEHSLYLLRNEFSFQSERWFFETFDPTLYYQQKHKILCKSTRYCVARIAEWLFALRWKMPNDNALLCLDDNNMERIMLQKMKTGERFR
jgi:hypothetical protein